MQAGNERRAHRLCCIANNDGFVSAYGLAILCIVLTFAALCTAQIKLCSMLLQQNKQHETELYILHHVKKQLHQDKQTKISSSQTQQTEEDTLLEEEEPKESYLYYQNCVILLTYDHDRITASYQIDHTSHIMTIVIDEHKEIMKLTYS